VNLAHHANEGYPDHILWLCNQNNLLLAIGLLAGWRRITQIAILWLIPAFPLWLIECYLYNDFPLSGILAHGGALLLGFLILPVIRMNRYTWIYALIYAFAVQQISRWITLPSLNINVAFRAYSGWEQLFPHYWQFWLFIAIEAALGIFLICYFLSRKFPEEENLIRSGGP
jgi:hypothetical protein